MQTKDIRLERLRLIISQKFNGFAGQCADELGMKRPQLSRWITKSQESRQGISDVSARYIEQKLGYPRGWLDGLCEMTDNNPQKPAENELNKPTPCLRIQQKKTRHEEQIEKIATLLSTIDLEGLAVVLREAERMAEQYPLVKKTPASST